MFWDVINWMMLDDSLAPLSGVYHAGAYSIVTDGMHALFVPRRMVNWKGVDVAYGRRLLHTYSVLDQQCIMVVSRADMLHGNLPATQPVCPECHCFASTPVCTVCDGLGFAYSTDLLKQYPRTDGAMLVHRPDILLSYRSLWLLQTLVRRLGSCRVFRAFHPDTYVFRWDDVFLAVRGIKVTLFHPKPEGHHDAQ